tara:strand:+ start:157 stop:330 length:174 start_codon:yes stop_codon:yes gene_type:complete
MNEKDLKILFDKVKEAEFIQDLAGSALTNAECDYNRAEAVYIELEQIYATALAKYKK